MKNKTIVLAVLVMALISSLSLVTTVNAACNLPGIQVMMTVGPGQPPVSITLSGVPAGYDVTNTDYTGYCIELGTPVVSPTWVDLVCTDNAGSPWNEINWLLNNYLDSLDLQMAIWRLLGYEVAFITSNGYSFTVEAGNMYTEALGHSGFDPVEGNWVGVRLVPDTGAQDLLIKIQIPEEGPPGFTPGFWKHNIGIYLTEVDYDDVEVKGHYSAFKGGALDGVKCDATQLATLGLTNAQLYQIYRNLCPQLDGVTAEIRANQANWLNEQFGYGPFSD